MHMLRLLLILILSISLCACCYTEDRDKYVNIGESQNSLNYIFSSCNYEELHNALSAQPSMNELQRSIPIDFIKTTAFGYETIFQTDNGLVLVGFNSDRLYSYAKDIRFAQGISEAIFDNIAQGTSLSMIQKIDPYGDYSFLYASVSGVPVISHHYLESGAHYTIYYDEKLCVINIEKRLI